MRYTPLLFLLLLALASCEPGRDRNREVVARVGKDYLYLDELEKAVPAGLSREDSLFRAQQFIRSWLKEELLFQKAVTSLSKEEKDKKQELDNYYRSLISHAYEEKMTARLADSFISNEKIKAYYEENERNFELKRNIIRLLYVKVPIDAEEVDRARYWVRDFRETGLDSLKQYAGSFADNMVLDTASWFYFDDITKEIPIDQTYSYGHFVRNNTFVELKDSSNIYLINIVDRRIRDDIAPLPLVKERIKNILRHQQEVEFLQKLESQIYQDAQRDQSFEIYRK